MERKVLQTYLYDFYGELLTEHQRNIYEAFVLEDLSLVEIAQEQGISRQGVHDLVRRCDRILKGYEEKLHLLERFMNIKAKIGEIYSLTREEEAEFRETLPQAEARRRIRRLAGDILEEL